MDAAVKLEREKRKTAREVKIWEILTSQQVLDTVVPPAVMAATFSLGQHKIIQRDLAGILFALEGVYAAARMGVHDKLSLLGIFEALGAVYALSVPGEPLIDLTSWSKYSPIQAEWWLGEDRQFFGLSIPGIT